MNEKQLAAAFTAALQAACRKAAEETGVEDVRFVKEMEQRGGAEALRGLWKRRRLSPWFDALAARGRLELSPEAIAIQSKYGALFTDDEVNVCFSALLEAGWRIG